MVSCSHHLQLSQRRVDGDASGRRRSRRHVCTLLHRPAVLWRTRFAVLHHQRRLRARQRHACIVSRTYVVYRLRPAGHASESYDRYVASKTVAAATHCGLAYEERGPWHVSVFGSSRSRLGNIKI
ncbi:unnamed protein product [Musa banksii]